MGIEKYSPRVKEFMGWLLKLPDKEKAERLVFMYSPPKNVLSPHLTGEKRYKAAPHSRWPYARQRFSLDWVMKYTPGDTANYRYNVPIRVNIDYKKCPPEVASQCFKCLAACPSLCFVKWPVEDTRSIIIPKDHHETGRDPEKWVVTAFGLIACNQCGTCAKVCPKNAISITTVPITKPYSEVAPVIL